MEDSVFTIAVVITNWMAKQLRHALNHPFSTCSTVRIVNSRMVRGYRKSAHV